ncbi:uncharacterized protein ARMOST_06520 [Armillaria ostoyae]|uniref:Uncharacterized protein n=1 Tax=Armillaria ostoyae TaxID=47428 RepID=A0A284R377_ARMOS|nr:uncharacterized protein ARMOST_06520 [Armillaria ostoyae]
MRTAMIRLPFRPTQSATAAGNERHPTTGLTLKFLLESAACLSSRTVSSVLKAVKYNLRGNIDGQQQQEVPGGYTAHPATFVWRPLSELLLRADRPPSYDHHNDLRTKQQFAITIVTPDIAGRNTDAAGALANGLVQFVVAYFSYNNCDLKIIGISYQLHTTYGVAVVLLQGGSAIYRRIKASADANATSPFRDAFETYHGGETAYSPHHLYAQLLQAELISRDLIMTY